MSTLSAFKRGVVQAVRRLDVRWVVDQLVKVERTIADEDYRRMVLLTALEGHGLWKHDPKYGQCTWQEFLRTVCPGFGNEKYQHCKNLLRKFGHGTFQRYGGERLVVVARYRGYERKLMKALDQFVEREMKLPAPTTIANMGDSISGKPRPKLSEVLETENTWRERFVRVNKWLRRMRLENADLRQRIRTLEKVNRRMKEQLRRTATKMVAKLAAQARV